MSEKFDEMNKKQKNAFHRFHISVRELESIFFSCKAQHRNHIYLKCSVHHHHLYIWLILLATFG